MTHDCDITQLFLLANFLHFFFFLLENCLETNEILQQFKDEGEEQQQEQQQPSRTEVFLVANVLSVS